MLDALGKGPVDLPDGSAPCAPPSSGASDSCGRAPTAGRALGIRRRMELRSAAVVSGESESALSTPRRPRRPQPGQRRRVGSGAPLSDARHGPRIRRRASRPEPEGEVVERRTPNTSRGPRHRGRARGSDDTPDRIRVDEENIRAAFAGSSERSQPGFPTCSVRFGCSGRSRSGGEGRLGGRAGRIAATLRADEYARAEMLLLAAVTAVEVGDDPGALAAGQAIRPLIDVIDDPVLRTGLRMAVAWILPIIDDLDGALASAAAAAATRRAPNTRSPRSCGHDGYAATALQHDEDARPRLILGGTARGRHRQRVVHAHRSYAPRDHRCARGTLRCGAEPDPAGLDETGNVP